VSLGFRIVPSIKKAGPSTLRWSENPRAGQPAEHARDRSMPSAGGDRRRQEQIRRLNEPTSSRCGSPALRA
jgi:hypothetical protein